MVKESYFECIGCVLAGSVSDDSFRCILAFPSRKRQRRFVWMYFGFSEPEASATIRLDVVADASGSEIKQ